MYIIKEGVVNCQKGQEIVRHLYSKDFFGELSILFETKRTMSIVAKIKTKCYQISKSLLIETLGENFCQVILSGICSDALRNTKFFNILSNEELFKEIYILFNLTVNSNNKVIFPENHFLERKLCVVIEGNLINVKI